jgi:hypothetical protein
MVAVKMHSGVTVWLASAIPSGACYCHADGTRLAHRDTRKGNYFPDNS